MKSILITYETETWNGETWEPGEAATKLDFIDDDTAAYLVRLSHTRMDVLADTKWQKMEQILRAIEFLRRRYYVEKSIKSIQILDTDKE